MENSSQRTQEAPPANVPSVDEAAKKANQGNAAEELPVETSPYVNYDDLEDYKRKAYGTEGHVEPVDGPRGAGATDAPTPSGRTGTATGTTATSTVNSQGVP